MSRPQPFFPPRHAHRGAQFPGFRLLLARYRKGALEVRLRF
jgi:hypothetical protein